MEIDKAITDLFALAIQAETAPSRKEKQLARMKAGKIRRQLTRANEESKDHASGVKITN